MCVYVRACACVRVCVCSICISEIYTLICNHHYVCIVSIAYTRSTWEDDEICCICPNYIKLLETSVQSVQKAPGLAFFKTRCTSPYIFVLGCEHAGPRSYPPGNVTNPSGLFHVATSYIP